MSKYREHMTDAMIKVYDRVIEQAEEECLYCLEQLIKANTAENIKLPHTNERGIPVIHGARLLVNNVSNYWYQRLTLAKRFVSREFEEKHMLWNRNARL